MEFEETQPSRQPCEQPRRRIVLPSSRSIISFKVPAVSLGEHDAFDSGLRMISAVFFSGDISKQSSPASKLRSCKYPLKGILERGTQENKGEGNWE